MYEQCVKAITKPDSKFGMKDGCSLLGHWNFKELIWNRSYELCRPLQEDWTNIFDDCQFLISYLGSAKEIEEKIIKNFSESMKSGVLNINTINKDLYSTAGLNLCLSIVADYKNQVVIPIEKGDSKSWVQRCPVRLFWTVAYSGIYEVKQAGKY